MKQVVCINKYIAPRYNNEIIVFKNQKLKFIDILFEIDSINKRKIPNAYIYEVPKDGFSSFITINPMKLLSGTHKNFSLGRYLIIEKRIF